MILTVCLLPSCEKTKQDNTQPETRRRIIKNATLDESGNEISRIEYIYNGDEDHSEITYRTGKPSSKVEYTFTPDTKTTKDYKPSFDGSWRLDSWQVLTYTSPSRDKMKHNISYRPSDGQEIGRTDYVYDGKNYVGYQSLAGYRSFKQERIFSENTETTIIYRYANGTYNPITKTVVMRNSIYYNYESYDYNGSEWVLSTKTSARFTDESLKYPEEMESFTSWRGTSHSTYEYSFREGGYTCTTTTDDYDGKTYLSRKEVEISPKIEKETIYEQRGSGWLFSSCTLKEYEVYK